MVDVTNIFIKTNRLILRPWKMTDLNDFYEYASVEGVGELAGWPHHENIEKSRLILDDFINKKEVLAIVYKENNKVIGSIGIHNINENIKIGNLSNCKEIGYVLSKDYWNLGLMTEAVKGLIRYIFFETNIENLFCGHFDYNDRSRRVIVKNNFRFYQNIDYKTIIGHFEKTKIYLLTKKDYLSGIEKLQLFNNEFEPVDDWMYRDDKVPDGFYRGVVDAIIKNVKYNKYLLTLRDRNKNSYPNCYETTGGSITYKEDSLSSIKREVNEETGICDGKFTFLYSLIDNNIIFYEYYCETSCELDSIVLQEGETVEYLWLDQKDYLKMWNGGNVAISQKNRLEKFLKEMRN